eukprot:5949125-Pleurochrysis_carterae.AAC.2
MSWISSRGVRRVRSRSECPNLWRNASRTRLTRLSQTSQRMSFPPPPSELRRSSQPKRRVNSWYHRPHVLHRQTTRTTHRQLERLLRPPPRASRPHGRPLRPPDLRRGRTRHSFVNRPL